MDGMKAVRLPRDRPHRTRVPQDRVRRQRHRSREPGYPRKSNLPGIQEIAWLVRDPCPQQSASSDPPANHSRDSHETRRFYTVWVRLGHPGDVRCTTALPPKADVHARSCYVAFVPVAAIAAIRLTGFMEYAPRAHRPHYGLMLAAKITLPHFMVSSAIAEIGEPRLEVGIGKA